ncbi:MAG: response regulator transcription factor [Peptococcaceae bacterium]|nr:response regulator transcription factor [Peptococcaceae bacterium]
MTERILLIEDEEKMARMVELELVHEGYEVEKAFDGISGLAAAEAGGHDVILLDIMLPGLSGMEVLRRFRKHFDVPVILLTARDAVMDKVSGLDSGADDYITKPFAIEELLARIRASLRKKAAADSAKAAALAAANTARDSLGGQEESRQAERVLTAGPVVLDPVRHEVKVNDQPVELTFREFELLRYLLENKGLALSRDVLLERVWGYDYAGNTNVVDVYIRFLRGKIDDQYGVKLIHTLRGVGYQIKDG